MIPATEGKREMDRMEETLMETLMVDIGWLAFDSGDYWVVKQQHLQEAADSHPGLDRRDGCQASAASDSNTEEVRRRTRGSCPVYNTK